ncbi:hypothetical protein AWB95_11590 [Mycobacterium celatum]|uniref:Uncharacterized protein n=1 Tax=Mycobacterium celatum TaxID=28045 RepID=A0A1X1RR61_MYCCE|nr:hypothetical protein AWB95_11590 [Mycobacterium celatum]
MLDAVVLHADLELLVTHVEPRERIAKVVADHDLRLWPRQASIDQNQPRPGFLWRFSAAVHQVQHLSQLRQPSRSAMSLRQVVDFGGRQLGGVGQRIHVNNSPHQTFSSAKVERRPRRCGCAYTPHCAYLVIRQFITMDHDAVNRFAIAPVQLRW